MSRQKHDDFASRTSCRDLGNSENCPSKIFHRDDDGTVYCEHDHKQTGYRPPSEEDEHDQVAARTTRKAAEFDKADFSTPKFDGVQANELFLQCYQLILWKQVHWLVHEKGFPVVTEIIVKDLWELRLRILEGFTHDPNDDEQQPQSFPSQSEYDEDDSEKSRVLKPKTLKLEKNLRLVDTVSTCYLALLLERLPVSLKDVYEWMLASKFPYLNAVNALPQAMRQRLPLRLRVRLNARAGLPDLGQLAVSTMELASAYSGTFAMEIPPINYQLLSFRYAKGLSLPLEVLPAIPRLASRINLTLSFPREIFPYTQLSSHPEVRLMSLLIIVVKLFYPFEGDTRYPRSNTEPAGLSLDWTQWTDIHSDTTNTPTLTSLTDEKALATTEEDVFTMSSEHMDDYLDWFQRTWISEKSDRSRSDFDYAITKMFPINKDANAIDLHRSNVDRPDPYHKLKQFQRTLLAKDVVSDSDTIKAVLRPGALYKHYRNKGELPESAILFCEKAAEMVNLSLEGLLLAVFQTEMKMKRVLNDERNAKREPQSEDDTIDDIVGI